MTCICGHIKKVHMTYGKGECSYYYNMDLNNRFCECKEYKKK